MARTSLEWPGSRNRSRGTCRVMPDWMAVLPELRFHISISRTSTRKMYIAQSMPPRAPDLLFVTGLSQIVKPPLLNLPRIGCIGFHPTWLPKGRGRAPLGWLVLDGVPGAATFFLDGRGLGFGADTGPGTILCGCH